MEFRHLDKEKDYEELTKWWKFWRFPIPHIDSLPDTGIMISVDGVDVVCGFLYLTNSNMCWIEFIVSNPEVKEKQLRKDCISICIDGLCTLSRHLGYKIAYTSLKNQNLQNKFLECGFLEGSTNCNEYIKVL